MDNLFKELKQKIKIILAVETMDDYLEQNKSYSELPPIPIDAIVCDMSFGSVQWKIPNINVVKAKEVIVKKNKKSLIEKSYKIQIDNEFYEGYKPAGKLQFKEEGDYYRFYCYILNML